jgi:hypothetical protein
MELADMWENKRLKLYTQDCSTSGEELWGWRSAGHPEASKRAETSQVPCFRTLINCSLLKSVALLLLRRQCHMQGHLNKLGLINSFPASIKILMKLPYISPFTNQLLCTTLCTPYTDCATGESFYQAYKTTIATNNIAYKIKLI